MNWIDFISWSDMIGYAGTGFTIMAYSMRRMLPLRVAAVLSSVTLLWRSRRRRTADLHGTGPAADQQLPAVRTVEAVA